MQRASWGHPPPTAAPARLPLIKPLMPENLHGYRAPNRQSPDQCPDPVRLCTLGGHLEHLLQAYSTGLEGRRVESRPLEKTWRPFVCYLTYIS